ncbi:MAG: hypothetical protein CK428_30050 [Mycobacterium sp.]|nr:MAG: hypothetical protein CK428_30050 [Mycobacterium sp.]
MSGDRRRELRVATTDAMLGFDVIKSAAGSAKGFARAAFEHRDSVEYVLVRLGGAYFYFDCTLCRQPSPIKCVTDRCEFDRISNVGVDRHLQQFARHPIGRFL